MLPAIAALFAAALFAVATALQHRTARDGPSIAGSAKQRSKALAAIVTRPVWLVGVLADTVGFACHAYALTHGELALVQPLLVTGLFFALPLGATLAHRRMSKSEVGWGCIIVVCLAVFLGLANPTGGDSHIENGPAAAACLCAFAIAVMCILLSRSAVETRRAAALGVLTGLLFGISAALVKEVGSQIGNDLDSIFTTWPLYALLVIGPASLAVNQLAFQAGPLSASLPALTAVDPLASIVLGVLLFDERLHGGPISAVLQTVSLLVMTVAIVRLAGAEGEALVKSPPN